ncbi:radical SAM protein [Archaeoglobus neptunius]|uniref:radical SAM protein n=1 Tax=Archaeoglobus neptunius TaxID=2798580 RepID=UPI001926FFC0|nr:radical SAM protein [Archaeoglobus neptunius]
MILYLAVTQDCNLRCIYCYAGGGERRDYMDFSTAKNVMERYNDRITKVQFTGGEPMLNYRLIKRFAERYDADFSLQTNATLLDCEKIEELAELGVSIAVSIDAPPNINDRLRPYANGEGSTRDVLRSMMLLKSQNVNYGITCVVTPYNQRYLRDLIDMVYAFGAKSVSFDVLNQWGEVEISLCRTRRSYGVQYGTAKLADTGLDSKIPLKRF